MDLELLLGALLLGIVEGLTEFLPVSSTGHLILVVDLIGFQGPPGQVFEVVIQLGAIGAVCWEYFGRFARAAAGFCATIPSSSAFVRNLLLAFVPTVVIGALAYSFIKAYLFDPWVVVVTLVLGGIAILVIERNLPAPALSRGRADAGADRVRRRPLPGGLDDPGRVARRRHDHGRPAARRRPPHRDRVLVLPRGADDARRLDPRPLPELGRAERARTSW